MKKLFWGIGILVVLISVGVFLLPAWAPKPEAPVVTPPATVLPSDPAKAKFTIDGAVITFDDNTKIFGVPVIGDLDKDLDPDAVFMIQEQSGGTGTFYYVAAAINTGKGYKGTEAIFIGDRISPQNMQIKKLANEDVNLIVNYADRKPDEPFTAQPSVGKSMYLELVNQELVDVTTQNAGQ